MKKNLEIGSSWKIGPDWDLMSIDGGDIRHDIRRIPWPIADNSYELVYMSHVLEHIHWMDSVAILEEAFRIVKSGGAIEVHVPDFRKIAEAYFAGNFGDDDWWEGNPGHDPGLWVNGRLLRGQVNMDEPAWYNHQALFDERHLANCLAKAGFGNMKKIDYQRGAVHGWINLGMRAEKVV